MHNNIGGSTYLPSDGYDLLQTKLHARPQHYQSHDRQISPEPAKDGLSRSVSFYAAKAEFYSASISDDGGYKILAQSVDLQYVSATGQYGADLAFRHSETFKAPSPLDVANRVLGFVENRLNSELEAGADGGRISKLISQAREGIQKGFSQARDDIESLGLMTETLDKEIDKGYNRIELGLTEIEKRLGAVKQAEELVPSVAQENGLKKESAQGVDVSGKQVSQSRIEYSVDAVEGAQVYSRSAYQQRSDFLLKTQDGDTITIRFDEASDEVFKSAGTTLFFGGGYTQAYQLEVEGELDDGELAAISDLFAQLEDVSRLFFSGDFQQAFASALTVGFDASEIADFSLDLSSVQTQTVTTYANPEKLYQHNVSDNFAMQNQQPLIEMVRMFEDSLNLLKLFDAQQFDFRALVLESVSKQVVEKNESSHVAEQSFSSYAERLMVLLAK